MRTITKQCTYGGKLAIKAQVTKAVASKYTVISDEKDSYTCSIRGKIKWDFDVFVGDYVEIDCIKGKTAIIEKVYPRKNVLIRPYVSNIDCLIIVVAPVPQPDWTLVDKLIINCYIENIEPVLCYHKSDLTDEETILKAFEPYRDEMKCIRTSVLDKENGLSELYEVMEGKLCCFAGQSAVGKSSIINEIFGKEIMEVCGLSERVQRGKNTTRHIEIFDFGKGRVVDTCGFSLIELENLLPEDLTYYYEDYVKFMPYCKYKNCSHINEPDCRVKHELEKGTLSEERYQRYIAIYNELKEKQNDKY